MNNPKGNRVERVRPYLDIARDLRAAWRLLWDRRVPLLFKAVPFLSLAYVLMPADLLPDLVLGLGQLDDLAILLLGLKLFVELATSGLAEQTNRPAMGDGEGEIIDATYRVFEEEQTPFSGSGRKTRRL
ncbi:MAG: DUF1232 domain-containing protein [Chloroflexi bacterium]|nr:DUF1232 domain-containing protein [Chloroflexota bacterium]